MAPLRVLLRAGAGVGAYVSQAAAVRSRSLRGFHSSLPAREVSQFLMPAMSPTMTEGGIAQWKVKEGDSFSAGDVLLEIETDKAMMDVEAQDDGVMGKIVAEAGSKNVQVGQLIAMLAEEGDDLSSIKVPEKSSSSSASAPSSTPSPQPPSSPSSDPSTKPSSATSATPTPTGSSAPSHALPKFHLPFFPSVQRLLLENHVDEQKLRSIKGTGKRGMITKGDLLAALGLASGPNGTFKEAQKEKPLGAAPAAPKKAEPLTPESLRHLILSGLSSAASLNAGTGTASSIFAASSSSGVVDFNAVVADYDVLRPLPSFERKLQVEEVVVSGAGLDAKKKDPFAGLY